MAEHRVRGGLAWVGMGAALLVATILALGVPDVGLAGGLLSGAYPTLSSAVAFTSLICYVAVLVVLFLGVAGLARTGRERLLTLRPALALTFLIVGAILLGLSVAGRMGGGNGQLCCGSSPAELHEAVSLVR